MPAAPRKKTAATPSAAAPAPAPERLEAGTLEALIGYNTRRAYSVISALFFERMAPYGLKQVEYSVLALLAHNPGATSRQLCATLDILPPNLVSLISALDRRGLIERRPHPRDGRAIGLHLTAAGLALAQETEQVVIELESDAADALTARERETLRNLLQKLYKA
ncbi:MarR family transcriptional regulator [Xenophilus arseniciresistens]|uniref:MarR family transcriptional regulator n=1 Tax=Xenophilus arseniciresistens TaxID=1283306 RepID=A0AAE3N4N3_9BURK|nr:MarR family transcriptional regulator [Xenophilus arseniciresistens]MDA7415450.1 MarR family transcriptional regulator [Xenophilus arseniciresistens]